MAADTGALTVDIRKLGTFNRMAKRGASTVASHLADLTGMETSMEITKVNFVAVEDVRHGLDSGKRVGITIDLLDPPHGEILFLLDAGDAATLAAGMVGGGSGQQADGTGFSDMERSAIQEIGNILSSGFIDGWADVLETTIDISTPSLSVGPGSEMVDRTIGDRVGSVALVFDSQIRAVDADLDLTVYTVPELPELVALMQDLDP